jgi:hypothetical protein
VVPPEFSAGVPLIVPFDESVRPLGSEPDARLHVQVPPPTPRALSDWLYAELMSAPLTLSVSTLPLLQSVLGFVVVLVVVVGPVVVLVVVVLACVAGMTVGAYPTILPSRFLGLVLPL